MRSLFAAAAAACLSTATPAASAGATAAQAKKPPAQAQAPGHPQKHPQSSATITPIIRSGRTISGQPLRLPSADAEVVAVSVDIPAGGGLPIHQHPWSRFVYVERGSVRVVNHDTGQSVDFKAGAVLPEAIGQWHEARAIGSAPVRLIVLDLVPPGVNNTIMKSAPPPR